MWGFKCLGLLSIILLLLCVGCKVTTIIPIPNDRVVIHSEEGSARVSLRNSCGSSSHYTSLDQLKNSKTIRVNFHFMNAADGTKNFSEVEGREYAKKLLEGANRALGNNQKMWLPPGNETAVLPIGYRYQLTPSEGYEAQQGIYHHYDDALYYYVATGRNKNNYDKKVINRYAIGLDSILNIFMMPHHPDSVQSKAYSVSQSGIALGNAIKLTGIYEAKKATWAIKGLLNHEIGHVMTLRHSWSGNDGCKDTPNHPNCWNKTEKAPCDTKASNNLMDYNANQNAWTPCQIGKIHSVLSRHGSRQRALLVKDWCTHDPAADIIITDSVAWEGARDFRGNITLSKDAYLKIACRVSMPKGAKIILQEGATLHLGKNAWLHNDCNETWAGIFVMSDAKSSARVLKEEGAKISEAGAIALQ